MAEHDERDSVASRDAFEKVCRRYFFHRRASIIADLSRHEERELETFVVPLPVWPRETGELVRVLRLVVYITLGFVLENARGT